ncbi:hypothetical protein B0H21DRAFT_758942 [Amylocystis lapponica]|nr:hypothetical protein B0H21DRAFT_758942 [Amylocystis lapponica]
MSNSSIDGLQQAYINLIQTSNMNNLCLVAAVALYAYDYLLTFSGEVELIWRRKFTGVTVLFVLNRYTGVLLQISELLSMLPLKDRSVLSCRPLATLTDVCNLLIIMVDALFSALRIYAIWNGDWRPAILVPVLAFIYIGIAVGVMSTQQVSLAPPPLNTCGTVFTMDPSIRTKWERTFHSFHLSNALYTCTIVGNILVLIFTWIRTYGIHKLTSEAHTKASIATLILRDGASDDFWHRLMGWLQIIVGTVIWGCVCSVLFDVCFKSDMSGSQDSRSC